MGKVDLTERAGYQPQPAQSDSEKLRLVVIDQHEATVECTAATRMNTQATQRAQSSMDVLVSQIGALIQKMIELCERMDTVADLLRKRP